ncbi:MAG: protein-(glutamine-N5) methyltransferase, release factor-specific [Candidatus Kerfeldbacteria bacterium RIFOXYA2_FULL_38_24]|uniref:Release factor glutamine methyltransferase n=1 Tax=Candidatus Kerfeldbacteria bacterium RIFOXYB2_FULL_38_14 TaxID=1798547 RepID=A0A1G2BEQ3_9BACT|nr:MAG: protein-(glutamine-N5) methyltransferase, release factor-specific [Candidatus Kerfeldbacteria bacterium RIFOXYA2_FULL_38_24]OGY87156.1 MAG: protein-(glutamine-N5) methyltransferase, release factor-specific [Candidatus Kerfeldbacteria bacterium RIFOXYB2_FULL_38_14]OGY88565.1 MAG: protein-(glutamine-N5) methyltransferase, release factor-specific [Candidatus Kerfeldbacteria bacterium RIFOXYC2_FULL_38_9]
MNVRQVIIKAVSKLQGISATPRLDVELILTHVLKKEPVFLLIHPEYLLTKPQLTKFKKLLATRKKGEPMAYLLQKKEFYGRVFYVDERVLIPRPETELLIDTVLGSLKAYVTHLPHAHKLRVGTPGNFGIRSPWPRILDIGTGSGCVAITLKKELPKAKLVATDISGTALTVAQKNARNLKANIKFIKSDLFANIPKSYKKSFDVIVSNPPYVNLHKTDLTNPRSIGLKFEPKIALQPAGGDAVSLIEKIITEADDWLTPTGALLIEIGFNQGKQVKKLADKAFPKKQIKILKDLSQKDRIIIIR